MHCELSDMVQNGPACMIQGKIIHLKHHYFRANISNLNEARMLCLFDQQLFSMEHKLEPFNVI